MKSTLIGLGRTIAIDFIPELNNAAEAILLAYERAGLLEASWTALGEAANIAFGANAQKELANWTARLDELKKAQAAGDWHVGWTIGKENIQVAINEAERELVKWTALVNHKNRVQEEAANISAEAAEKEAAARDKAADALRNQAKASAAAAAQAKAEASAEKIRTDGIKETIEALELQALTFGLSTAQIEIYKLAMAGATDEQLALAEAALGTIAALERAEKQQAEANKKIAAAAEKTFGEDMADAMTGWASGFSSTLNEMVWDADIAFDAIAESFAKMVTQMVLQKAIIEPLMAGMTSLIPFGVASSSANKYSGFPDMHQGGVVGATIPRLHSGLFADEFPAILQKGETVIPKGGGAGGCNVKVIVNNMGQDATAQQQDAPRWNGQEWVVTVWMDAYNRNVGGLRRAFGG